MLKYQSKQMHQDVYLFTKIAHKIQKTINVMLKKANSIFGVS